MNSIPRELLIICDASPLILLAKVGRLDLVGALADEVWIPAAVWKEVVTEGAGRPEVALIASTFAGAVQLPDAELVAAFRFQVDEGEAAAMALAARNRHACLLMDDARGRALAELNHFRCIGTLGLLVRAKRGGLLPALRPVFRQLRVADWYIEERLLRRTLMVVDES
ncbi:MAG: DUF3368 domain-containing protein [Undibacterium sp.]|nr:DUF3368 domain-containing protein [Opitutaceae bacterium]